jgi:hypothetical protein
MTIIWQGQEWEVEDLRVNSLVGLPTFILRDGRGSVLSIYPGPLAAEIANLVPQGS